MKYLRVVELNPDLAAAYCGRLFAGAGADVVLVERPDRPAALRHEHPLVTTADGRTVSALWEYVGCGVRSVVAADDAEEDELLAWADVVISVCDGDPDAAVALRERIRLLNPSAVHVVVSGYGLTGPYREWKRSHLTAWAGGGHMYLTGLPEREPLQGGGPWISYLTGATAAIAAQAAVLHAVRTGEGQLVDVSALEAAASLHQWTITQYTHTGAVKRRWGNRFAESIHPIALYPCIDGWISIVAPSYPQFEALCLLIESPELLLDPEFRANGVRFDRADEIDPPIIAWTSVQTCGDAVEQLQGAGVPASPLKRISDMFDEAQLKQRGFWREAPWLGPDVLMPDLPFRSDAPVAVALRLGPAPTTGAHTDEVFAQVRSLDARPPLPRIDLATIRMTEFGVAWAGPLAARWLADLGVDVVKVEHPASRGVGQRTDPDPDWVWGRLPAPHVRYPVFPGAVPGERWWNRQGLFNKMNRSKRSLCLDAKTDRGADVLRRVLGASDVVLHNYSPRGAASLGVDAAGVRPVNPRAVTVSLTGYGQTGPLSGFLSYGPVLQAHAGFDEATGYDETGPVRLGLAFPDCVAGLHGAFAAINALWERELYDRPVHVDLSEFEALLCIAGEMILAASVTGQDPVRHANRSESFAPQGAYRCAGDDEWVAVTVADDEQWAALVVLVGPPLEPWARTSLAQRRAAHDEIDAAISAWSAALLPIDAAAALQQIGVVAFPVMTNRAIVEDPHLRSRGFIARWDQTDVGPMEFPGFPVHFERLRPRLTTCPGLGADNEAVLTQWVAMAQDEVSELIAQGVLGDRPPAVT